jgi:hypothetical protein
MSYRPLRTVGLCLIEAAAIQIGTFVADCGSQLEGIYAP